MTTPRATHPALFGIRSFPAGDALIHNAPQAIPPFMT